MKHKLQFSVLFVLLALLLGTAAAVAQGPTGGKKAPRAAVGTAFTYQGQLKQSGSAVTNTCDFEFSLWDGPNVGANQIGGNQPKTNVTVSNGLFTIPDLDFGGAFNGDARYLLIGVRCPAGSGSFTILSPRQPLTPAPYALALPGLYTQQNVTSPNIIGGYSGNSTHANSVGSTISGGGVLAGINTVLASYGTIGGGANNTVSADWSTIGGGVGNTANNNYVTIGGGFYNSASSEAATVPGGMRANATHYGEMAYASGQFATAGDAQTSVYVLRNTTSNATQTELFLDGSARRITIASNRTLTFDILIAARSSTTFTAGYHILGVIENEGGTTKLTAAINKTVLGEDLAAWDVDVQADDTNDALVVKVTGAAATNIRWVASVRTVEVAY